MIVTSAFFGLKDTGIYPAPLSSGCIFFSNNIRLQGRAEQAGWRFIYLPEFPLVADFRTSSLQSKYVKFLQYDVEQLGFSKFESVLYFDHKFFVKKETVDSILSLCKRDLLIRYTPRYKNHVQDEIDESCMQDRYKDSMPQTIRWIKKLVTEQDYVVRSIIMNTGLIFYRNPEIFSDLCKSVYSVCQSLEQPECQIVWSILSQRYLPFMTCVNWSSLDVLWKTPSAN